MICQTESSHATCKPKGEVATHELADPALLATTSKFIVLHFRCAMGTCDLPRFHFRYEMVLMKKRQDRTSVREKKPGIKRKI